MEESPPMNAVNESKPARKKGLLVLAAACFAVLVAGVGMSLAQASGAPEAKPSASPATTVAGAVPAASTEAPTREDIEREFESAKDCLADAGLTVERSNLSITRYDVSTLWVTKGGDGAQLTADEQTADANCQARLAALGEAWTAASNPPYEALNRAVSECISGQLPDSTSPVSEAQSLHPEIFRSCMDAARESVLGISAPSAN
jgi:hypothetical protein